MHSSLVLVQGLGAMGHATTGIRNLLLASSGKSNRAHSLREQNDEMTFENLCAILHRAA